MSMGITTASSTPVATPGTASLLFHTAGASTEKALAASGAYTASNVIVPVHSARKITLFLAYDAAAIGGYPVIVPLVSAASVAPATGADSWFTMPIADGSFTSTVFTGALPAGQDFTLSPGLGLATVAGLAIKPMPAALATSDEVRASITLDVSAYRYFQLIIAEVGVTATPGSALITYSLTA